MTGMPNRGLSKDEVARTALAVLDNFGLPDFTMRRLAAALDVQQSSLYWHFPNKQTLLAELSDRIVGRDTAAIDGEWPDRIRREALSLRDALLAFRDGAEVVASSLALGLGENRAETRLREALDDSPFDPTTVRRASATLLHFILGHVSLEQQRLQYDSLGARDGDSETRQQNLGVDDFEFGVKTIISGLQTAAKTVSSS